jgi:hypothetical protein
MRPPVFRILTHILTAIAIFAHSLFGCCSHNADAHETAESAVAAESPCCCCSHGCATRQAAPVDESDDEATGEPENGDGQERKHCHEESCSFVAVDFVKLSSPSVLPTFDLPPVDEISSRQQALLDGILRASDGSRAGIPRTLRAQQWLGVWLI